MPQFTWITWLQARQALAARLADPGMVFWSDPEIKLYLAESLRTYNALTETWNQDYAFSATPASVWYDLSVQAGSPRLRTLTNNYLYSTMEYMLLEPSTGGTWTGTSQFSIADLQGALQRRRDEMIQATGCNLAQLPSIPSVINTRRLYLPDSTLEPRRARFVPDSGPANTMTREDTISWNAFEPSHLQTWATPQSWSVITIPGPPLAMDVDNAPPVGGVYDVISLQAGLQFAAPVASLLSVPDDWSWLAKWGALADLLGRDSEATDRQRADYCLKRFNDGIEVMKQSNWLISATLNGLIVDTPSVREMDGYSAEWQDNSAAWPSLVTAGMDLCAPCPVPQTGTTGISCILVGNQPVPVLDGDYVQIGRDVFDAILDYAQCLASFKMGGAEFLQAQDLEKNFFAVCLASNKRLVKMGLFSDIAHLEGNRQNLVQPR
jgi:hypothetical protein